MRKYQNNFFKNSDLSCTFYLVDRIKVRHNEIHETKRVEDILKSEAQEQSHIPMFYVTQV